MDPPFRSPKIFRFLRKLINKMTGFPESEVKLKTRLRKVDIYNKKLVRKFRRKIMNEFNSINLDETKFRKALKIKPSTRVRDVVTVILEGLAVGWTDPEIVFS